MKKVTPKNIFSAEDALRHESAEFKISDLSGLMENAIRPEKLVLIVIVDDDEGHLLNMQHILGDWPNITVDLIHDNEGSSPVLPPVYADIVRCNGGYREPSGRISDNAKIVLLDEDLVLGVKGKDVHEQLLRRGFRGIVASITEGKMPYHVKYHFRHKASIGNNYKSAIAFVRFINALLSKL